MADTEYPLVGYHFYVEVQGKLMGAFREATGLTYPELIDELIQLALERPTGLR